MRLFPFTPLMRLLKTAVMVACLATAAHGQPQPLFPGDANQDLVFGPTDIVLVLQAGKYLSGHPATWGEGDWERAPGGQPGNPPAGDALFDIRDLIAALGTSRYCLDSPPCKYQDHTKPILAGGTQGDDQTSLVYDASTGEFAIDAPQGRNLTSILIASDDELFGHEHQPDIRQRLGGAFDAAFESLIFKATFGSSFGSLSFGPVIPKELREDLLLNDLSVMGSLYGGGDLGPVDLVYMPMAKLQPGDANQDGAFNQVDIVQVLQAGKYLTGAPATWGEGDWDGAPGGSPGDPTAGDGLFDQQDIVVALQSNTYLTGAYAAIRKGGVSGDEQTSIVYDARTGEIAVDAPASRELYAINIDSAAGIFTNQPVPCEECDPAYNIFHATFGSSFSSRSFGNAAQPGLTEDFIANDLSVIGSLWGGGALGDVDLIYVPEPAAVVLLAIGLVAVASLRPRLVVRSGVG
jgi:hypothetical protein